MKFLKFTFIIFFSLLIISCTQEAPSFLKEGHYLLQKIDYEGKTNLTGTNIQSGVLHVKGSDSIIFEGVKNIGDHFFGNDHFGYELRGSKLILQNKDFKENLELFFDQDSLLRIDIHDNVRLYFERLKLDLEGEYSIVSYEVNPNANKDTVIQLRNKVFEGVVFDFKEHNTVEINQKMVEYLLNDPQIKNNVFGYTLIDKAIVFNNSTDSLKLGVSFDGVLHFYPNDKNFKRFDLIKRTK